LRTIHYVREGMIVPVIALIIWFVLLAITACVVFLERGERKIPVHYTRRIVGQRVYGGQSAYIPFRINNANIMPVIFAGAALNIPMFLSSMLSKKFTIFRIIYESILPTGLLYNVLQFGLIFFFTFVYTSMIYDPQELSETMKKNGGFIPGIRPGKKTADFFNYILTRIGVVGALYLGILAALPNLMAMMIDNMPFYLGGTALLIVVGVALETAAQIESYLIEHRYDGFLSSGRITGRRMVR
jgi:preprotein translocase subunit SecY